MGKLEATEMLDTSSAFWHCMTLVLGLGTLTMPLVFKQLGWFGAIVLAALAVLSAHTAKLLCLCVDYTPKDDDEKANEKHLRLKDYPDIGEAAFGKNGRQFVMWILYVDLVASSALFLVFCATNMDDLFAGSGSVLDIGRTGWIILTTISLYPTVHMKLNKLSYLSKFGSYIMIILVLGVLWSAVTSKQDDIDKNHYDLFRFDLGAIGNIIFAFSCHGTLLTIYRQMQTPKEAGVLFNRVYGSGYLLKFLVGATGYYLFGQNVSDQISLNLPNVYLKTLVTFAVTAKKWLTYALPLEPVAISVSESFPKYTFTVRSLLVVLTGILALLLPFFGLFQALVGSLCAGFLVLIFPIGFYMKLYGNEMSKSAYNAHVVLLLVSALLVLVSSYCSLAEASEKWVEFLEQNQAVELQTRRMLRNGEEFDQRLNLKGFVSDE